MNVIHLTYNSVNIVILPPLVSMVYSQKLSWFFLRRGFQLLSKVLHIVMTVRWPWHCTIYD